MTKLTIPREELGEALRTALRKCCDSPQTTIAWQVVRLLTNNDDGDEVWGEFLDVVYDSLNHESIYPIRDRLKNVCQKWASTHPHKGNALTIIFQKSLLIFSNSDWCGFATFIEENNNVSN